MPQYHQHYHPFLRKITITPLPFWRNWFRFLPYFVGDIIRFRVQIETPQERPRVFERFGNNKLKPIDETIESGEREIKGNPINSEGDIECTVSFEGFPNDTDAKTIITARAINKDRWFPYLAGVMIGVFLTALVDILTGFLDIVKSWRIWIP